jgi:3-dehydroquinate dehydratase-2
MIFRRLSCCDLAEIIVYVDIYIKFRQNSGNMVQNDGLMKKILVLHGPNLNLLGVREPSVYGSISLSQLNEQLQKDANASGFFLNAQQSNSESELINAIHQAMTDEIAYIIINPAGFTHTSIAMRDALLAVQIPFIEVHISNVHARESFRRHSYFSDIAVGVISGLGTNGYMLALHAIIEKLK